jgi:hypothetical protein
MIVDASPPSQRNFAPPLMGAILGYVGGVLLFIGALAALATFMGGLLYGSALIVTVSLSLGLLTSILILLSSSMLYNRPKDHFVWGWMILFFGLIGFGPWNFFGAYAIGSILYRWRILRPGVSALPSLSVKYECSRIWSHPGRLSQGLHPLRR